MSTHGPPPWSYQISSLDRSLLGTEEMGDLGNTTERKETGVRMKVRGMVVDIGIALRID